VSLINLDLVYGLNYRLSFDLTVPFAVGSAAVAIESPNQIHTFRAGGLGDMAFQAEYWLSDPAVPSRVQGSVGLGFQAPTGSDRVEGTVGSERGPLDESAQLGTGGWNLLLNAQGTAQIAGPWFAYGSGFYGLSLGEHSDVVNFDALRGIPDTYSGRLGAAYLVPLLEGLVVSFGGRINGVAVKDLIGGGDLYWRRPGYEIYYEPGLTWTRGPNTASLSFPVRAYAHQLDSLLDVSLERKIGADFAPFLFLASYARRF